MNASKAGEYMAVNLGSATIKFTDNSRKVLETMKNAKEAVLTNIGIAAKRKVQDIVLEKHIFDTGELHRTIDYNVRVSDSAVDIGSPKSYAPYQELGTRRIPARPFIQPGVLGNVPEYQRIAEQTLAEKFKD